MLQPWQLLLAFSELSDEQTRYFITQMNRYLFCSVGMQKKMREQWEVELSRAVDTQAD